MPTVGESIKVKGLAEMSRAFAATDSHLAGALREALREVAEPVQQDAEELAANEIRNIGPTWSKFRIGTTRKVVYVAPSERGRRGRSRFSRPNLATLLMERSMQPALDKNAQHIEQALDDALGDLFARWTRWHA